MADTVTAEKRSWIMSRVRSESSIERIPRQFRGWYLRRHPSGVVGRPDFGNKRRKIAVFIDGCFWHGCPKHFRAPKTNVDFWRKKISANRKRDRKVDNILLDDWWMVVRVWEHELVGSEKDRGNK